MVASVLKLQTGIKKYFQDGGMKCAHLGLMSAWIATLLGRDFKKIILFRAQFLRVKIGRNFARKGLRGGFWTHHFCDQILVVPATPFCAPSKRGFRSAQKYPRLGFVFGQKNIHV